MKRKKLLILPVLLLTFINVYAQESGQANHKPLQYDIAAGLKSYYVPGMSARWASSDYVAMAGVTQLLNERQTLGFTLRLGYARGKYQGDAIETQLLLNFTPVIAKRIEAGIALGAGYQFSFYPSQSLQWIDNEWIQGKSYKGLLQIPTQLSIGYRSFHISGYEWRPYLAYQLKALFGYNPDLSLFPVSHTLIGFKISSLK